jgi:hypothetical protein
MRFTRRSLGMMLLGAGGLLLAGPAMGRLFAQDPPNRREFTIVAKDFRYTPARIEVTQDDLVKLTVRSEDIAHSFTIDEYRIVKRVPAGGSTTFEFRRTGRGRSRSIATSRAKPGTR